MYEREINGVIHRIYEDIKEFNANEGDNAVIDDWRKAEDGDWCVSDDGQVCKVLYSGKLQPSRKNEPVPYIRTLFGTFLQTKNVEMSGEPIHNIWCFSNRKYNEIRNRRKEPTKYETLFAYYVARGMEPAKAYIKAYPTNNKKYATVMGQRLMKTERVQGAIREEVEGLLDSAGVSKSALIRNANSIAESADSDATRLRAIEYLLGLYGVSPKTEKKSESITLFQGFTREQLDAIDAGEIKVKKIQAKVASV